MSTQFGCAVHAYVLMTNHVHLLLNPQEAEGASLLMKYLGQRYVQYGWSSYRTNAEGKASALLTPHPQYLALGSTDEARRKAYRQLFRSELDPQLVQEIRDANKCNLALGGERFKRQVEMILGRRVSRGQRGRPRKTEKPSKPTAGCSKN